MGSASLSNGHPQLVKELAGRIRDDGPLPFDEFMQAALYHPLHGYYASGAVAIGGEGADFRTSPEVHPVFAEMLCAQVVEMYQRLGAPERFRVVELGPGNGRMAAAFLARLAEILPDPDRACWEYHLVDSSQALIERQQQTLQSLPESSRRLVCWSDHEALSVRPSPGVVLSNEFFDALPVARVRRRAEALEQSCVGWEPEAGFVFDWREPRDATLQDYFRDYGVELAEGQVAEAGLEALGWMDRIAALLPRGYVITIDYGYPAEVLYAPARSQGTLVAYQAHRAADDPLHRVGQQDLTAHVNFTALERRGQERGLEAAPLRTQTKFLLGLGVLQRMQEREQHAAGEVQRLQEVLSAKELFIPGGMGETFKVLVQSRDAPLEGLAGLSAPWHHLEA
jgi:SAM-dependent MidA family methyltransferase